MRSCEETAAFIRGRLAYAGNAELRRRVWADVLGAYHEALDSAGTTARGARPVSRHTIVRLAALVALIAGLFVAARYTINRDSAGPSGPVSETRVPGQLRGQDGDDQPSLFDEELIQARELFARGDLAGLVKLLESGQPETKIRVAEYLGRVGDRSVLPALRALAGQWSDPTESNPFDRAIDAVRLRHLDEEPSPNGDQEPNQATHLTPGPAESKAPPASAQALVTGVVVDRQTQTPIRGAAVGFRSGARTSTDTRGRFVLTHTTSRDMLYLYAGAPGYAAHMIALRAGEDRAQDVEIALGPGSRLTGAVVDPNGTPVEDAAVSLVGLQSLDWTFVTDPNGAFEFEGLDPAVRGYLIHVTHPAHPSLMPRVQPAAAGQTLTKRLVLEPGVVLFGQVTDAAGRPVAGVTVGNTTSARMWNCVEARTDAQGRYQLGSVRAGEHVLWDTHEQYAPFVGRAVLRRGESEHRVDIQLVAGRRLSGRVVDDRGRPIGAAEVKINSYELVGDFVGEDHVCDPNGRFTIPNAPDQGTLYLLAQGNGIVTTRHQVDFTQDECVITVPRTGRIYGRVLDAQTSQPISRFTVTMDFSKVTPCSAGFAASWSEVGHRFDSAEGLFDTGLAELPVDGTLLMTVSAEGYDPVTIDPVVVVPIDPHPSRTEFRLPPARVFVGQVMDTDGRPISAATVMFFSGENLGDPGQRPATATDDDGMFTISGLGPRDAQFVHVSAAGFGPAVCAVADLLEAPGWLADVVLEPAAGVEGRVTDGRGVGVADAQVQAFLDVEHDRGGWHVQGLGPSTLTDANGYYRLSGLPGGRVTLSVVTDGAERIIRQPVDLTPGAATTLDFVDNSER